MSAGPIVDSVQQGAPPAGLGKPTPDFHLGQFNQILALVNSLIVGHSIPVISCRDL